MGEREIARGMIEELGTRPPDAAPALVPHRPAEQVQV